MKQRKLTKAASAVMTWNRLLTADRLGRSRLTPRAFDYSTGRGVFLGDIDRLTFCASFRRLARKTQVFPLATNDHIHNRLTHSLEVSRVGRTLGTFVAHKVLSNPKRFPTTDLQWDHHDIGAAVEAASLAHDIGHPPFGHAGDRAVRRWFTVSSVAKELKSKVSATELADLTKFDGNAQGFRRITQLEKNLFAGGLNLTYTTLAAYIKYPTWTSTAGTKNGFFLTEREIVETVAKNVGLTPCRSGYCRHPLSYLVEAADDICYGFLDLEDAVEMRILDFHDVAADLLKALPSSERRKYQPSSDSRSHRTTFARMRGKVFHRAIENAADAFFRNYSQIMAGTFAGQLIEDSAAHGDTPAAVVLQAKERARREIFQFDQKAGIELGCYSVIEMLLDGFGEAAIRSAESLASGGNGGVEDPKLEMLLGMFGDHRPAQSFAMSGGWNVYKCMRRAIDFVSGMTDEFAIRISRQLSGEMHFIS